MNFNKFFVPLLLILLALSVYVGIKAMQETPVQSGAGSQQFAPGGEGAPGP